MNIVQPANFRILSVTPSTNHVGFAVLEGRDTLVDWGGKRMVRKENRNAQSLAKVEELIVRYRPDVLVLEDVSAKSSRRCPRIRKLFPQIVKLAAIHKVIVKSFSREQVMQNFIPDGQGTKHDLAEIIAKQFPDQLGSKLPPKRKPWMTEHYQMGIFDAVALALAFG